MTNDTKIEELLNSYVDGELTVRQRTQVKRLAANNPEIARRLRQVQKSKMLINALPVTQAPPELLGNIKAALKAKEFAVEPQSVSDKPVKTRFVLLHRVMAAAAMIMFAAVMVFVINMLTPDNTGEPPFVANNIKFSGSLELKTNNFVSVNSDISKAINKNGLSDSTDSIKEPNRRLYVIKCTKEGMNRFLSDLDESWDKLYSASLSVDTDVFGQEVEIDQVLPGQIAEIANQTDEEKSIEIARDFAIMNRINKLIEKSKVPSFMENMHNNGLVTIPVPYLVKNYNFPPTHQENGEKTVVLRIAVSR